ncbi:MAG TPA: hypothetical protein VIZ18_18850 [Ktedonobacteraceae bacterium]
MPSEEKQFNRQGLIAALQKGWKHYLSCLAALSDEEQARYAREQGFLHVQDVLVHIFAWWERSMQRTAWLLSGPPLPPAKGHPLFLLDMDEFNADVVAQHEQWSRAASEEKFAATLAAFERFLIDLPETALEHEHIQTWMRIDTIDHYEAHRPPNGPAL